MSDYKGTPIPQGLAPQHRVLLEGMQEYLTRFNQRGTGGTSTRGPGKPTAVQGRVILRTIHASGTIASIPIESEGTILQLSFTSSPTLVSTGNLKLVHDYVPVQDNETLTLISTGTVWLEVSRGESGFPTFVPAAKWSAIPNTGVDISGAVQTAISNVPSGSTLFFETGTYLFFSMVTCNRSDINIWLDPGVLFQGDSNSNITAVLNIEGPVTATAAALTGNIVAGRQDAIGVTTTTGFAVNDWVVLIDFQAAHGGGSSPHLEINRIRSIVPGTSFTLWYPVVDAYTTANSATFFVSTPVENVRVTGGGKITNTGTDSTHGGHGVRIHNCVNVVVDGIEVADCRNQCVAVQESLGCSVKNGFFHDGPAFNGSQGYGLVCDSSVGTRFEDNYCARFRHAIDVSFFSRNTLVSGNEVHASAFSAIQLHPDNIGTSVIGNTIDGARGFVAGTPATEMGDATDAPGISIREFCSNVLVANNTIHNTQHAGISFVEEGCSALSITGNTLRGTNWQEATNLGAIYCEPSGGGFVCPGLSITNNTIDACYINGIVCAYDEAIVDGNIIRGLLSSAADRHGVLITSGQNSVSNVMVSGGEISGGEFGVYLGGDSLSGTGDVLGPKVIGVKIHDTELSGIYVQQTANVLCLDYVIERNVIYNCNTDESTTHAGINAYEVNSLGSSGLQGTISANTISNGCRVGIQCGLNGQIVARNHIKDIDSSGGVVGIGIYVRDTNAGSTVRDMVIDGNNITGCIQFGIRIGDDSAVGTISESLFINNVCVANAINISERTLAINNHYFNNKCFEATAGTSYGIYIDGDNTRVFWNTSGNRSGTSQDYGIFINTNATGTILHDNYCFANNTSDIKDNGTTSRVDTDWFQITTSAASPTLTAIDRYCGITSTAAARTVTLPAASAVQDGHEIVVKDESGGAGTNNITVSRAGADTIDGAVSVVIATNYGSVTVKRRGAAAWFII